MKGVTKPKKSIDLRVGSMLLYGRFMVRRSIGMLKNYANGKNSNKSKLVKSMYRVYHESQEFNWLLNWIYVFRYALYSKKKYKNVK